MTYSIEGEERMETLNCEEKEVVVEFILTVPIHFGTFWPFALFQYSCQLSSATVRLSVGPLTASRTSAQSPLQLSRGSVCHSN